VTKKRVEDNINIFDFVLSSDDMAAINALNRNYRIANMDFATNHKDYPFNDEY
jgi:diketogulonate reductase-like aldo/keto reductase